MQNTLVLRFQNQDSSTSVEADRSQNVLSEKQDSAARLGKGMAYAFIGVVIFALTLPVTKLIIGDFNPVFVGQGRAAIAGVCAGLLLWFTKARFPERGLWPLLAGVCLCVGVLFSLLIAISMQKVQATTGGIMSAMFPIATAAIASFIERERLSKTFWFLSVVGAVLAMQYAISQSSGSFGIYDWAMVASVGIGAAGYACGGVLSKHIPGWQVVSWALVITLPLNLILTLMFIPDEVGKASLVSWVGLLYLALFSQWLGFFVWNHGLALGGTARVSQVQLLQTFLTIGFAALLLGENIDLTVMVYGVAILLIVVLTKRFG